MSNRATEQPYLIKTIAKLLDETDVKYEMSYNNEDSSHVITYTYKPKKISRQFRVRCFYTDEHCGVIIDGFEPIKRGKLDLAYLVANELAINYDQFKFVVYDNVTFSMVAVITNRVGEEDEELLAKQIFKILSDSNKILPEVYARYTEVMGYELSPKKVLESLSEYLNEKNIPFNLISNSKGCQLEVYYKKYGKNFAVVVCFLDGRNAVCFIKGFGICPKKDRERCLELINELNSNYKFKFYITEDDIIGSEYLIDISTSLESIRDILVGIIANGVQIIDETEPKIAECITAAG